MIFGKICQVLSRSNIIHFDCNPIWGNSLELLDGNYVVRLHLKCLTWSQRIRLVICDESLFDESLCDVPLFDAS